MATLPVTPIVCRECGAVLDLWAAIEDAAGRQWVKALTDLPPVCIRPLRDYLRLHKPAKQALSYTKLLKLTRELAPMIASGQVMRNGIAYGAPSQRWVDAMTSLVDHPPKTLTLPLKGNGYLLSIVASAGDKDAAQNEKKEEDLRQHRAQSAAVASNDLHDKSQAQEREKRRQKAAIELKKTRAAARGRRTPRGGESGQSTQKPNE